MSYNKNYLFTHNIDWYACINGTWIYAASRGGLLPGIADNDSILPKLQGICSNLPNLVNKEEIIINKELIKLRYQRATEFYRLRFGDNSINNQNFQNFLREYNIEIFSERFSELFVEMASKGFYSFVRLDIDNPFSNEYKLVAYPKNGTPTNLSDIIQRPFNDAFQDQEYVDYIKNITIKRENTIISFDSNLDILF